MPLFTSEYVFSDDYPTIEPSLKLDFANARALDPRITFTRASTATYVGRDGLIKTAGVDEARFDHDPATGESLGLLIEESRTNYAPLSEDYSTSTSTIEATITTNTQISPDGTQTADTITANSVQSTQHGSNKQSTSLPANSSIALSVFVKAGTSNYARIDTSNTTNWSSNAGLAVDLSNGNIISGSGTVVKYPNGWWRITTIGVSNSSTNVPRGMWVWVSNASGASVTNLTGTESIHVWGAQLEVGAFSTSYIPTSGATATRATDAPFISGESFNSFYNQSEGTVICKYKKDHWPVAAGNSITYERIWEISNGSDATNLNIFNDPTQTSGNNIRYRVRTNSTNVFGPLTTSTGSNQTPTVALGYAKDNFALAIDGTLVDTDTSGDPPVVDRLHIGSDFAGTSQNRFNNTISKLIYYPKRLTNTQLQTLTQ